MTISTVLAAGKCPPEDTLSTSFFRFYALKTHDFYQNFKTVGVIVMSDPRKFEENTLKMIFKPDTSCASRDVQSIALPPTNFYDNIPYYSYII